MARQWTILALICLLAGAFPATTFAQVPFDPHDFSGVWEQTGGARGINREKLADVPEFTPEGQKMFDANLPARGRLLGQPLNGDHPGLVRARPPALSNDPISICTPQGPTRLMLDGEPMEFIHLNGRTLLFFQWGRVIRELWTDGRELPTGQNLSDIGPSWFGLSVGKWEGDTFAVNTIGLDDRTWLDIFGFPHSAEMRLEERFKRVGADKLEIQMTVYDPKVYKKPFVSDTKTFTRMPRERLTYGGWYGFSGFLEGICAAVDELDFNKRIRDPAGLGKQ